MLKNGWEVMHDAKLHVEPAPSSILFHHKRDAHPPQLSTLCMYHCIWWCMCFLSSAASKADALAADNTFVLISE